MTAMGTWSGQHQRQIAHFGQQQWRYQQRSYAGGARYGTDNYISNMATNPNGSSDNQLSQGIVITLSKGVLVYWHAVQFSTMRYSPDITCPGPECSNNWRRRDAEWPLAGSAGLWLSKCHRGSPTNVYQPDLARRWALRQVRQTVGADGSSIKSPPTAITSWLRNTLARPEISRSMALPPLRSWTGQPP